MDVVVPVSNKFILDDSIWAANSPESHQSLSPASQSQKKRERYEDRTQIFFLGYLGKGLVGEYVEMEYDNCLH